MRSRLILWVRSGVIGVRSLSVCVSCADRFFPRQVASKAAERAHASAHTSILHAPSNPYGFTKHSTPTSQFVVVACVVPPKSQYKNASGRSCEWRALRPSAPCARMHARTPWAGACRSRSRPLLRQAGSRAAPSWQRASRARGQPARCVVRRPDVGGSSRATRSVRGTWGTWVCRTPPCST